VGLGFSVFDLVREAPACWAQRQALVELEKQPGKWSPADLVGLTDAALERTRSPSRFGHPKYVALRNGFPPIPCPDLVEPARYCAPFILFRPDPDTRRLGFVLSHEIGEGILDRSGFSGNHSDVQLAACLLAVHSRDLFWLIQRMGVRGATAFLVHRHRYAPAWTVRVRVEVHLRLRRPEA
jgi:hypothetical protein